MLTMLSRLHRHLIFAALLLVGAVGAWASLSPQGTNAQTGTYCSVDILLTQPLPGSVISGTYPLQVNVPSTSVIGNVTFYVDYQLAGTGRQTSSTAWNFDLNTQTYPNGIHNFYAVVEQDPKSTDGSMTYDCRTNTADAYIQNSATPTTSSLELTTNIPSWSGPTNYPVDIFVKATLVTDGSKKDVTAETSYGWKTTLGHIDAFKNTARFNSGPTAGDGTITVRASYSNHTKELSIPIKISSATTSTTFTAPTTSTTTTTTQATPTTETTTTTTSLPTTRKQSDPVLENCLTRILGAASYQQITEQDKRLSFADYSRSSQCFAQRKFIIPANLAPVAPEKVAKLPLNTDVDVGKLETITGNGKKAIRLTGRGLPNKTVFIYIFSEPLVLSTKTGSDGQWSYTLEDPLAPGTHEAYVTVEGDTARPTRSNAFNFAVAAAPITAENPLGLSYQLENTSKPVLFRNLYLAGSLLLIATAVIAALFFIRRRRHPGGDDQSQTPDSSTTSPPVPPNV